MSDIISARCFSCGNVIKVPAALGGKKARCPKCTNTITIPSPSDTTTEDIISDADLPEVAREGDPFKDEDDAPYSEHLPGTAPAAAEDPSEVRRKSGTGVRRGTATGSHARVQRSGTQPRYTPGGGGSAPKAGGNNNAMMIGIGLGVVGLILIGVAVASGGSHGKNVPKSGTGAKDKESVGGETKNAAPSYTPEEQALVARVTEYAAAVNRGDGAQVFRFYTYEAEQERSTRIRATEIVDAKTSYDGVQVRSVNVSAGTTVFSYAGGREKALQWKQVDGVWMIAEKPTP